MTISDTLTQCTLELSQRLLELHDSAHLHSADQPKVYNLLNTILHPDRPGRALRNPLIERALSTLIDYITSDPPRPLNSEIINSEESIMGGSKITAVLPLLSKECLEALLLDQTGEDTRWPVFHAIGLVGDLWTESAGTLFHGMVQRYNDNFGQSLRNKLKLSDVSVEIGENGMTVDVGKIVDRTTGRQYILPLHPETILHVVAGCKEYLDDTGEDTTELARILETHISSFPAHLFRPLARHGLQSDPNVMESCLILYSNYEQGSVADQQTYTVPDDGDPVEPLIIKLTGRIKSLKTASPGTFHHPAYRLSLPDGQQADTTVPLKNEFVEQG